MYCVLLFKFGLYGTTKLIEKRMQVEQVIKEVEASHGYTKIILPRYFKYNIYALKLNI